MDLIVKQHHSCNGIWLAFTVEMHAIRLNQINHLTVSHFDAYLLQFFLTFISIIPFYRRNPILHKREFEGMLSSL